MLLGRTGTSNYKGTTALMVQGLKCIESVLGYYSKSTNYRAGVRLQL